MGGSNVGYHPRQWNNQTSCWGTAENLKSLIATLHHNGVKVIADIVVNHRAGNTGWGNFTTDDFGTYGSFQLTADHICRDDEMNTDKSAGTWYGTAKGAKDTGENWNGARDLDHTSAYVQQDIVAYLNWLHGEWGYDGWLEAKLTFISSASFDSFKGVQVDGKTLAARNYTAGRGSIKVCLKPA